MSVELPTVVYSKSSGTRTTLSLWNTKHTEITSNSKPWSKNSTKKSTLYYVFLLVKLTPVIVQPMRIWLDKGISTNQSTKWPEEVRSKTFINYLNISSWHCSLTVNWPCVPFCGELKHSVNILRAFVEKLQTSKSPSFVFLSFNVVFIEDGCRRKCIHPLDEWGQRGEWMRLFKYRREEQNAEFRGVMFCLYYWYFNNWGSICCLFIISHIYVFPFISPFIIWTLIMFKYS